MREVDQPEQPPRQAEPEAQQSIEPPTKRPDSRDWARSVKLGTGD